MRTEIPIKPLDGQKSLLPDVPIVRKCRRCKRTLRGVKSIERKIGPTCARKERECDERCTNEAED